MKAKTFSTLSCVETNNLSWGITNTDNTDQYDAAINSQPHANETVHALILWNWAKRDESEDKKAIKSIVDDYVLEEFWYRLCWFDMMQ